MSRLKFSRQSAALYTSVTLDYLVLDPVQFPLFVSLRCLRKILRPDISQAFSVVTSEIDESDRGLLATFFFLHFRP
jgi:hypothetical protein